MGALRHLVQVELLAFDALVTDGAHHKQWYLERILEECGYDIEELRKTHQFEKGIAL